MGMNVASKQLCQELYKLSGWDTFSMATKDEPHLAYWHHTRSDKVKVHDYYQDDSSCSFICPAYGLGYLLRKLPDDMMAAVVKDVVHHKSDDGKHYVTNRYAAHNIGPVNSGWFDIPEDAACALAIELIKRGILKPSDKEESI